MIKELSCRNCKWFKKSNFLYRFIQYIYRPLHKIRGRCYYCETDFITVYEDEYGCVHFL